MLVAGPDMTKSEEKADASTESILSWKISNHLHYRASAKRTTHRPENELANAKVEDAHASVALMKILDDCFLIIWTSARGFAYSASDFLELTLSMCVLRCYVYRRDLNPGPLDLRSDALPIRAR